MRPGLTFDEYQKSALSTAVYPRQYVLMGGETVKSGSPSCIYPVFGLCGEIGEVGQVLTNSLGTYWELIKECGDVLWYVAAICSDLSINMSAVSEYETFEDFDIGVKLTNHDVRIHDILNELFIAAGIVAEATKKTIRDSAGVVTPERLKVIVAALKRVLIALVSICHERGIDFVQAAKHNLEKLASRSARGVISGSGDNR